jgi:hypothetical protein
MIGVSHLFFFIFEVIGSIGAIISNTALPESLILTGKKYLLFGH